jgi:regulator of RNase E activity RraA
MTTETLPLHPDIASALAGITTATLSTVLLEKGIRKIWMRGPAPLTGNQKRQVGRAFTLRFVPAREDLATPASWASPISTRAAIEAMQAGCITVVDAMGVTDAGIFGDILCARMHKRGVAALITDGVVRDVVGVVDTGLPVWCRGTAAPASVAALTFVGWQDPVACGGVAVFPNDVLEEVVELAARKERFEEWVLQEVNSGAALPGLYPPNAETKARYEAEIARSSGQ